MSHALHIGLEVSGRLAQAGGAIHLGLQQAAAVRRVERAAAVDSVSELACRLREARREQDAAEARAASAEARLVLMERALTRAATEAAALREALSVEREFSAGLREIIGA
ncbi:hypothetical protein [Methylobacterium mesophilicum]